MNIPFLDFEGLHSPIREELIYAFQDDRVVNLIKEVCEIKDLKPDENLYAGGLSSMKQSQFLNPHLDNSRQRFRSLS